MNIVIFFTFLIGCVVSHPIEGDDIFVSPLNITYFFYNTENANNAVKIKSDNIEAIKTTHFTGTKDTLVLIHGWYDNGLSPMVQDIKNEVFKGKHDINVIGVDWSPIWKVSNINDFKRIHAPLLGSFVAKFLGVLAKNNGLKYSQVTVVGHSAGGPITGAVGSNLKGELKSIVGLDTNEITKNCAKFVEFIHTSTIQLEPLGHADFFPNGGQNQTGCDNFGCNHARAISYYAESMNSKKFVSKQCENYKDYKGGKCNSNPSAYLGGLQLDTKASGLYYLDTNGSPPFARG